MPNYVHVWNVPITELFVKSTVIFMTYNLKVMGVDNVGDWLLFYYKTLKLLWILEIFEFLIE